MSEPAENYIPIDRHARFRAQARLVWGATTLIAFGWVGLIVLVPMFASGGVNSVSSPVYTFFSYICHQIPERSLHILGHQMAVCTRCFGVYFGLLAGVVFYPLWRSIGEPESLPRFWLLLALVPIAIDWSLTMFGIWENTHTTRFITGAILGAACATFIVPALVEITRNSSSSRSRVK